MKRKQPKRQSEGAGSVAWPATGVAWALTVAIGANFVALVAAAVARSYFAASAYDVSARNMVLGCEMIGDKANDVGYVAVLVGAVFFLVWLVRTALRAEKIAADVKDVPWPWGTALVYFAPIANLWVPYAHMRRLFDASDPALVRIDHVLPTEESGYRTSARVSDRVAPLGSLRLVRTWWATWLLRLAMIAIIPALDALWPPRMGAVTLSASDFLRFGQGALGLVVYALAIRVVRSITARQTAQIRRIAEGGHTPARMARAAARAEAKRESARREAVAGSQQPIWGQ